MNHNLLHLRNQLAATVLTFLLLGGQVAAMTMPCFSEDCAWNATDVVVATEGEKIDGNLTVAETWKGNLKPGEHLLISALAAFAPQETRTIHDLNPHSSSPRTIHVSGQRMVLFMIRSKDSTSHWLPASWPDHEAIGWPISVAWIESGRGYVFCPSNTLGPLGLIEWSSETDLKQLTSRYTKEQVALQTACSIDEKSRLAEAMVPFLHSDVPDANGAAINILEGCGVTALPTIRSLLNDPSLPTYIQGYSRRDRLLMALGAAGGREAGPDLVEFVRAELSFWKQQAPTLKPTWHTEGRADHGALPKPERDALLEHYGDLYYAVATLRNINGMQNNYVECRPVITELQTCWRSQPQLEGGPIQSSMILEECDHLLHDLDHPLAFSAQPQGK